jgi:hypothetical protein
MLSPIKIHHSKFLSVPSASSCFPPSAFISVICGQNERFFAVFSGVPAAIGFVFLCDLCDSARGMKPNEITAQIVDAAYRIHILQVESLR